MLVTTKVRSAAMAGAAVLIAAPLALEPYVSGWRRLYPYRTAAVALALVAAAIALLVPVARSRRLLAVAALVLAVAAGVAVNRLVATPATHPAGPPVAATATPAPS